MTKADDIRALRLCGTTTRDAPRRLLCAGPLSVVLQAGMIRYVRLAGIEILRAITFTVRTDNWGTLVPVIDNLRIEETGDAFAVDYRALCADETRRISYEARIRGRADGSLSFAATATPDTDVLTNRTGFTVLHPAALAGEPVSVEHVDGGREEMTLPKLISPGQPILLVRELTHGVAQGVRARCRMGPDAFETEDQRNWSDASFKTYVRPKAMPAPYVLRKGETFTQSVELSIDGRLPASVASSSHGPVRVEIGAESAGVMPVVGVGVPASESEHALAAAEAIRAMNPGVLVCGVDLRDPGAPDKVLAYRRLREATGASIELETIIPGGPDPLSELAPLASAVRETGLAPESVAIFPAPDLLTFEADAERPAVPRDEEIVRAARSLFPGAKIGGGAYAFFTELNRKRPQGGVYDFVTHTTCPTVHMPDDGSVMESIECLPHIFHSARAFIGATPYRIGPSAIGCRQNPDGGEPTANPDDVRVCKGRNDPRNRGLLAASWALAYAARCAENDIAAVSLFAATGPMGVIYRNWGLKQPLFDDNPTARVYPVYHALAGLAAGSGLPRLAMRTGDAAIAATGWRDRDQAVVWLANLASEELSIELANTPSRVSVLDAAAFDRLIASVRAVDELDRPFTSRTLALDAYAFARLTFPA